MYMLQIKYEKLNATVGAITQKRLQDSATYFIKYTSKTVSFPNYL